MSSLAIRELCRLCFKDVDNPKQLSCQHEFCLPCLEEYVITTASGGVFPCIACKTLNCVPEGGVDDFPCGPSSIYVTPSSVSHPYGMMSPEGGKQTNMESQTKSTTSDKFSNPVSDNKYIFFNLGSSASVSSSINEKLTSTVCLSGGENVAAATAATAVTVTGKLNNDNCNDKKTSVSVKKAFLTSSDVGNISANPACESKQNQYNSKDLCPEIDQKIYFDHFAESDNGSSLDYCNDEKTSTSVKKAFLTSSDVGNISTNPACESKQNQYNSKDHCPETDQKIYFDHFAESDNGRSLDYSESFYSACSSLADGNSYDLSFLSDQSTCDLCEYEELQYRCVDCEQNLCMTCKILHGKLSVCKTHNVVPLEDMDEFTVKANLFHPKDPCSHHSALKADIYCLVCKEAACANCTELHEGHKVFFIADKKARLQVSMKLEQHRMELNKAYKQLDKCDETLDKKYCLFKDSVMEICDQVDDRTTEMITRVKKVGETMKEFMKQTCDGDIRRYEFETNIKYLFDEVRSRKEQILVAIEDSKNDEDSIIKTIENIEKIKRTNWNWKTPDYPRIPRFTLHASHVNLDTTIFEHFGKIVFGIFAFKVSVLDLTLNEWQVSPKFLYAREHWQIRLCRNSRTLSVFLLCVSDNGDNSYTLKLVNQSNDKLSITKEGTLGGGDIELIDWSTLTDPKKGFLVNETVTVLVTDICLE